MITFGIITAGKQDERIKKAVGAIRRNRIPEYEIIVVGPCSVDESDVTVIQSDSKWIGEKKNIITKEARYPLIAYFHDYLMISDNWWNVVKEREFDVGMTRMVGTDGGRFRDWCLDCMIPLGEFIHPRRDRERLIPYHASELNKVQYISGAYWIARKEMMTSYPIGCHWGEDVEWSQRVRKEHSFTMIDDKSCYVKLLKDKCPSFVRMRPDWLEKLLYGDIQDLVDKRAREVLNEEMRKHSMSRHGC